MKFRKSLASTTDNKLLSYLGISFTFILIIYSSVYSIQTDYFTDYGIEKEFTKSFPLLDKLIDLTGTNPITTFHGNRHDNTQDITLSNYKSINSIFEFFVSKGGAFSCKEFTLANIEDYAFLSNNQAQGQGGAIYAEVGCKIINNKGLIIVIGNSGLNNANTGATPFGGAIACAGDCVISSNHGTMYFLKNWANNGGGAIYTQGQCKIQENNAPILFANNITLDGGGGAITSTDTVISNNIYPIYFKDNYAKIGGAISTSSGVTISNNYNAVVFNNNKAFSALTTPGNGSGGAIYTTTFSINDNPGTVAFDNNYCSRDGGAICTQFVTIKNSGPVHFTNNQGNWGGAIMLRQDSNCLLFADYGDIVFQNNTTFLGALGTYNSIHCTPNSNVQIGARKGYKVAFYDPIEHSHLTTNPLIFNPNPSHQGTVLFSSAYVPENSQDRNNFINTSKNTIELRNGILSIEDRAGWECYKFTQTGGTLKLGSRTSISTNINADTPQTSVGSAIIINNLAIDLPSIIETGKAPVLWIRPITSSPPYTEDNNPTITLSGPLNLLNNDNRDPYDSLNLSEPLQNVHLLSLSDVAARHINTDNFYPETLNATKHYGYQGIWSPYWLETITITNGNSLATTNTLHRDLYASWTPLGYKVNPEYQGDLATTPLWQSFHTVFAILRSYDTSANSFKQNTFLETQGRAEGLFVHQNSTPNTSGFRIDSTGYSLHASTQTALHQKVSLSFAQLFSNTKEIGSKNRVAAHTVVSSLYVQFPWLRETLATSGVLAYSYGNHHLHSLHPTHQEHAEGRCYSHTLAAALACSLPWQKSSYFYISPFLQIIAIRSNQTAFHEIGDNPRNFTSQKPLYNLTAPLGIQGQWQSKFHIPTDWTLEVSYQPTLYQQNPRIGVTLLASQGSWSTLGPNPTRNALGYAIHSQTHLFPHMMLSLDYRGSISSSTMTHYLQAGSILSF
ncbi:Polymorphic membrane protein F,chlamydial polymorphic outer membrane protein repeat,Autotransporter beta-domain [Chlamydia serpentis]|uniref:Polymorphic membrane protein F,chlamydial polymorphic outer membrane protein repeat,Autotransporter beta-domain n=1 Tax=Chlamydia serpentis TaxID=1967782 RepID=A0A2R8FB92_9CHLA|nr:polymorphic outer membrane protein middle domain-containing protein [Chlamydia serpentis]SPN73592.1 Polymorphic membrane protein F,chlamydial polymorphic outer membrane protein repeat,Autotransporter beta-domain [Chlamydia serpentis]